MRAELLVAFSASLLINAGVVATFDAPPQEKGRLLAVQRQKMPRPADSLYFEFVESPAAMKAKAPAGKTRRISDRHSVNRDRTPDKTLAADEPSSKVQGHTDQLGQRRVNASPASSGSVASVQTSQRAPSTEQSEPVKSVPQPAMQGNPPADRITAPELSRSKSRGAQLYGTTSFEATGSGMGVYMKNLKEKIWLAWFPYLMVHYPKDFQSADVVLNIKLNAGGELKSVEVFDSKGSPLFTTFCVDAVRKAAPFGPLPSEILGLLGKDELDIKFAFHYW